jgi:hypothetical protein
MAADMRLRGDSETVIIVEHIRRSVTSKAEIVDITMHALSVERQVTQLAFLL